MACFVANFVGTTNWLAGRLGDARPENLAVHALETPRPPEASHLEGNIVLAGFLGAMNHYQVDIGNAVLRAYSAAGARHKVGDRGALDFAFRDAVVLRTEDCGEICVKLLWSSRSPFVRKVVVVAHELGIADRIALKRVNVTAKETNAEVMCFNPLSKIPTLVLDDGTVMIDSPVIAEFLDETYGRGELFPRDAARRWPVRRLHALGDGIMSFNISRLGEKGRGERASEEFAAAFLAKTKATLDALERETDNLMPPTIGSIAVAVALAHLDFRFADDAWRDHRPKLAAWYEHFAARPSMRLTEPQDVY
jgi:glutathione S-transferase